MQAWHGLRRDLPSVVSYLGTGCYSFKDTKHGLSRDLRDDVLDGTKSPDTWTLLSQWLNRDLPIGECTNRKEIGRGRDIPMAAVNIPPDGPRTGSK